MCLFGSTNLIRFLNLTVEKLNGYYTIICVIDFPNSVKKSVILFGSINDDIFLCFLKTKQKIEKLLFHCIAWLLNFHSLYFHCMMCFKIIKPKMSKFSGKPVVYNLCCTYLSILMEC